VKFFNPDIVTKYKGQVLLDDKIENGFPPIVFGSDVIETDDDLNKEDIYAKGFKEKLAKQKIKKIMEKYYTPIEFEIEGVKKNIWIMNIQIKLWEDTFEKFNLNDFSQALKNSFQEKLDNSKKDYRWTPKAGTVERVFPTEKQIDNVFGVYFNYFDNLKLRGVEESHPKQQSINAIRKNVIEEEGPNKGKMVDGNLIQVVPINIYQQTLNNYDVDVENNKLEFFLPDGIKDK
jgi:hypothetical protein